MFCVCYGSSGKRGFHRHLAFNICLKVLPNRRFQFGRYLHNQRDCSLFKLHYIVENAYTSRTKDIKIQTSRYEITRLVACLVGKSMATIFSPNIHVGYLTMLTLSCFKHFLMLCRTRDIKIRTSCREIVKRIGCYRNVIITHIMSTVTCLAVSYTIRSQELVLSRTSKRISFLIRA